MSKRVHLDNLMRARLKKLVANAMPEYEKVLHSHRELLALVEESLKHVEDEAYRARAIKAVGEAPIP